MVEVAAFAEIQTNLIGGPGITSGQGLAILAPHTPSGSEVSTNVVKRIKTQRLAEEFFGAGSTIAEAFRAAKQSGIAEVFLVGVEETAVVSEVLTTDDANAVTSAGTTGDDTFYFEQDNLPLSDVSSFEVDGTPMTTITFTRLDPSTLTPGATEVIINKQTGKAVAGTDTAGGAGAVADYTHGDWDAAFDVLDLNDYEYAVPGGVTFSEDNWGIIQKFISHALDQNKMLAFGLDSAVAPADVKAMVEAQANTQEDDGRIYVLGAHYSGDLTAAIAGQLASRPVNSTRKLQQAPGGVTYLPDVTYTFSDFGDELFPIDGTFHEMGANAVYDNGRRLEISNDRAVTTLDSKGRFHSTARMVSKMENDLDKNLLALRRASDTGIPLSQSGIEAIRNLLETAAGRFRDAGIIDSFTVEAPSIDDIPTGDRSLRLLDFFTVNVRLTGQVHYVKLTLNAGL